jgi:hypothetical protein
MAPIPENLPDAPSTLLSPDEWQRSSTAGLALFDKRRFPSFGKKSIDKLNSTDVAFAVNKHEITHESLTLAYKEFRAEYMRQHQEFKGGDQSLAKLGEMSASLEAAAAVYGEIVADRKQVAETIEKWSLQHGYYRETQEGEIQKISGRNLNGHITELVKRVGRPEDAETLAADMTLFQEGVTAINQQMETLRRAPRQASLSESQGQGTPSRSVSPDAGEQAHTLASEDQRAPRRQPSTLLGRLRGALRSLSELRRARSMPDLPEALRHEEAPSLPPGARALVNPNRDAPAHVGQPEVHDARGASRAGTEQPPVSAPSQGDRAESTLSERARSARPVGRSARSSVELRRGHGKRAEQVHIPDVPPLPETLRPLSIDSGAEIRFRDPSTESVYGGWTGRGPVVAAHQPAATETRTAEEEGLQPAQSPASTSELHRRRSADSASSMESERSDSRTNRRESDASGRSFEEGPAFSTGVRPPSLATLGGGGLVRADDVFEESLRGRGREGTAQRSTAQPHEQERSRSPSERSISSSHEPQHRDGRPRDTPLPPRPSRSRSRSR